MLTQPANSNPNSTQDDSYVSAYTPPSEPSNPPTFSSDDSAIAGFDSSAATPSLSSAPKSEAIEDQNIFDLLGVNDGTEQEKERFLNELQQVIWEDFLEVDLDLLVTQEESSKVRAILSNQDKDEAAKQEEVFALLENLIPDLEEIMLEKALELKEDMVKERIAGMKEFYAGNQSALETIAQAEELLTQDKWSSAAKQLNSLN